MSDRTLTIYTNYKKIVEKTLVASALWPSKSSQFSYRFILFIHVSLCFCPLYGMYNFCRKYVKNIILLTKGLGIIISYVTVLLKAMCLLINQQDLSDLQNIFTKNFDKLFHDKKTKDSTLKEIYTFYYLIMSVNISLLIICACYVSAPMIFIVSQYLQHSSAEEYILPYAAVYPWKVPPKSLIYWITYAVQSLGNVPCICWTVSVDTAYTLYIFQMIGLLRGISYHLENLKNEKDYEATLCQCIDLYVVLMKCRDKIQKIFGPIILWTILSNGVVMCSMVFQITHMKSITYARLIVLCVYVFFKLSQTFTYAWVGTRLTTESENCIEVLSSIDWIGNKKLASILLIMLPQRSLKLTACNFSIVSVDMFLKVMNTTISYFFLLQTMDEK